MHESRIKIVGKFVEKMLKYRIMFKNIITFLWPHYRDYREGRTMYVNNIFLLKFCYCQLVDNRIKGL